MNASDPTLVDYDPWTYPQIDNAPHDVGVLLIGCSIYEAILAASVLIKARNKWKSNIYLSVSAALLTHIVGSTMSVGSIVSNPRLVNDLYAGPSEFTWIITNISIVCVATALYIYTTVAILLVVLPRSKITLAIFVLLALPTLVGNFSRIWSSVGLYSLELQAYHTYLETNDYGAAFLVSLHALDYFPKIAAFYMFEGYSIVVFTVITKMAFLMVLLRALSVKTSVAIKHIAGTTTGWRIVLSCMWPIVEMAVPLYFLDMRVGLMTYSLFFQITTLAILAFEETAGIVKTHTKGASGGSAKPWISGAVTATQSTLLQSAV